MVSIENRPQFTVIEGGNKPDKHLFESARRRYVRHKAERDALVAAAVFPEDADDIHLMNTLRFEREPEDVAAYKAWIGQDESPPPDPLKGA